ncbi:MAG: VanZ family protein [Clostridia bacterium]|nr:VanZ family protein [Clostridia bacterium]
MKKRNLWIGLYILFTAFIFCRSLKTAEVSTDESHYIVAFVESVVRWFIHTPPDNLTDVVTVFVRKAAHIFEFAVQSCIACRVVCVLGRTLKSNMSWLLFSGLMTACVDEAIQLTSDGRAGLISDVFIDFIGTVAGICISMLFVFISLHKKKKT